LGDCAAAQPESTGSFHVSSGGFFYGTSSREQAWRSSLSSATVVLSSRWYLSQCERSHTKRKFIPKKGGA